MLHQLRFLGLSLAALLAGCGGGSSGSDAVCGDFRYQEDAQSAYASGARQLDADKDGVACESLPHRPLGNTGNTGNTATVTPTVPYNVMTSLGEVIALSPTLTDQYSLSSWGPFDNVSAHGPLRPTTAGSITQAGDAAIGVRLSVRGTSTFPAWSSHGRTGQLGGAGGIGFVPVSRSVASIAGVYRGLGQACSQGAVSCTAVVGTITVSEAGAVSVCTGQDASTGPCTVPLALPLTRASSDPEGMFQLGHPSARLLASLEGTLAMSYQSSYASAANTTNPGIVRTTWFAMPYAQASLTSIASSAFEGFDPSGALIASQAAGWSLQDNVPLSGFRRDVVGRTALKGANGQLFTWSPEAGLSAFTAR